MFYSRYPGDGEGGLVAYMGKTFESLPEESQVAVPTIPPRDLPVCDVLKIDVEGAEASILETRYGHIFFVNKRANRLRKLPGRRRRYQRTGPSTARRCRCHNCSRRSLPQLAGH